MTAALPGLSWHVLKPYHLVLPSQVAFLIISSVHQNGRFYRERIIPSARTWMRLAPHVFVVVEDTVDARLALRHCHSVSMDRHNMTSFRCPREPTVILTRLCSSKCESI